MQRKIKHLCLIMAMESEAKPLIEQLQMESCGSLHPNLPPLYYQKQLDGMLVSVVLVGQDGRYHVDWVGTELATLTTHLTISALAPDMIISAGTAGGFATSGASIGSIIVSAGNFVYHDHHIPMTGFAESGIGNYPSLDVSTLISDLGFQCGVISSGSSLRKTVEDVAVLKQTGARAKDMESAAVAGICMLHDTHCFAVRSITNLVDEDNSSEQEFINNFDQAVISLTKALLRCINYLSNKTIADLSFRMLASESNTTDS